MKVCVATLCSADCSQISAVTEPNKAAYCERHGYELLIKREGFTGDSDHGHHRFAFERFKFFIECLVDHDAVLGCGADVIITNPAITLESLMEGRKPFIIAKDAIGFQTDVMLMRKEPYVIALLSTIVECQEQYWGSPYLDQTAMAEIGPMFNRTVQVVPQRLINAYDYRTLTEWYRVHENYRLAKDCDGNDGQWHPGDFIFHCPGLSHDRKIEVLKAYLGVVNNL